MIYEEGDKTTTLIISDLLVLRRTLESLYI